MKRDRLQHDFLATCVFAQWYSSTTFVPLCLYLHKEIFSFLKCYYTKWYSFLNCLSINLHNLNLETLGVPVVIR